MDDHPVYARFPELAAMPPGEPRDRFLRAARDYLESGRDIQMTDGDLCYFPEEGVIREAQGHPVRRREGRSIEPS